MLKNLSSIVFILLAMNAMADAGSTGMGNGGDVACEDRFISIRDDIASWINRGGSAGLTLPAGITLTAYNQGMLKYISDPNDLPNHPFKATVQCVSGIVMVDGAEKACKNVMDSETGAASITCNIDRFAATNDSDQYVLVHHEYAGLAGFEENSGTESDYFISNQISGYLENQVVKKLEIMPPNSPGTTPIPTGELPGIAQAIVSALTSLDPYGCAGDKAMLDMGNPNLTSTLQEIIWNVVNANSGTISNNAVQPVLYLVADNSDARYAFTITTSLDYKTVSQVVFDFGTYQNVNEGTLVAPNFVRELVPTTPDVCSWPVTQ
jgi:hypothetical protein